VCVEVGFVEVGGVVGVGLVVVWFSGVENFLIGWVVFCFSLCGCWVGVLWVGGCCVVGAVVMVWCVFVFVVGGFVVLVCGFRFFILFLCRDFG
ncbi:MAG: hypothetical protein QW689_05080, partial [Nitrososphaerota archaeon]